MLVGMWVSVILMVRSFVAEVHLVIFPLTIKKSKSQDSTVSIVELLVPFSTLLTNNFYFLGQ